MSTLDRFRADLARLVPLPARIGVAVSGGPDSMALLWLAQAACPAAVEAATVDHGLRPAAADEAAMVATWCAAHDIPHAILRPAQPITGNIQSAARAARYALLEQWRAERGLHVVLTAHHADDQLETLLMRLNRGSGVSGLAGVRARSGTIARPLLAWRKAELVALAQDQGLPFADDPSNADPRFDRAALRRHLATADWLDPVAAGRSAAALADAQEALDWCVAEIVARHIVTESERYSLTETAFPREIQRRLLLHMLALADPLGRPPRGAALDAALVQLNAGERTMLGDWLIDGGARWTLAAAPTRKS
ncbi:tRNA lysidine(34) synthetase TilS [Sphingobium algorifonticola]|uniref:tRNA(Ile)-lysidine synthase n=1 Tax=Sphingobium algorifonticola TaxID=2008318 RepID=A0A437J8H1_9SPHN|nr:tRNA lysidine(34) synthetase TilS [Sphingobium algorifonticola]RVT41765.1 tRNA lysidine(34) synthetase TilS [Sphingobium algorifonticola]